MCDVKNVQKKQNILCPTYDCIHVYVSDKI